MVFPTFGSRVVTLCRVPLELAFVCKRDARTMAAVFRMQLFISRVQCSCDLHIVTRFTTLTFIMLMLSKSMSVPHLADHDQDFPSPQVSKMPHGRRALGANPH